MRLYVLAAGMSLTLFVLVDKVVVNTYNGIGLRGAERLKDFAAATTVLTIGGRLRP